MVDRHDPRIDGLAAEVLREVSLDEPALRKRLARAACRCSFCDRQGTDAAHLAGPGVYICERCVDAARDITAGKAPAGPLKIAAEQAAAAASAARASHTSRSSSPDRTRSSATSA